MNNINYKSFFWTSRFNICYCLIHLWLLISLLSLFSFKIKITNRIFHISPYIVHFFFFHINWLNFQRKSWINMSYVNDLINLQSFWCNFLIVISYDWIIWYFIIFFICLFFMENSSYSFKHLFACFYELQLPQPYTFTIINLTSECSFFIIFLYGCL